MKLRAVCFDIDGTFYPNSRMYLRSAPLFFRHPRLFLALDAARKDLRQRRPVTDFHAEQAALVAARLGLEPAVARARIEQVIYRDWTECLRGIRLFPGVAACLERLRSAGLVIAVLSDFPVEGKLELLGLDFQPELILSSESTGYLKPNPEGFRQVVEKTGIPPAEILYVGNSVSCDVLGAQGVGMPAALMARRAPESAHPEFIFRSYEILADFVLKNT